MSNENEQQPTEPIEETTSVTEEPALPAALKDVDPESLSVIKKKLAAFLARRGSTMSGSEDPDSPQVQSDEAEQDTVGGVESDKPAAFRDTPQGPKWVAVLDEYFTTERSFKNHGKQVNVPGSNDKTHTEPHNLGEYITQMINGAEGWTVAAILPSGMGNAGVILRKATTVILPDPIPLKKEEEVEAPTDPELKATEEAAMEFAQEEGLTPPPVVEEDGVGEVGPTEEEIALSQRFRSRSEIGLEAGEVLEARVNQLAQRAIDLNRQNPDSFPVDAAKGTQPAPELPSRGADGQPFLGAAGVEHVREGMRKILEGGDFGSTGGQR